MEHFFEIRLFEGTPNTKKQKSKWKWDFLFVKILETTTKYKFLKFELILSLDTNSLVFNKKNYNIVYNNFLSKLYLSRAFIKLSLTSTAFAIQFLNVNPKTSKKITERHHSHLLYNMTLPTLVSKHRIINKKFNRTKLKELKVKSNRAAIFKIQ